MSIAACSRLLLAVSASAFHPLSLSSSRLDVEGRQVHVSLRCQATTLNEAVSLDLNADGMLDAAELRQGHESVESYLLEHYVLSTDARPTDDAIALDDRVSLRGRLAALVPREDRTSDVMPSEPAVDVELEFEAEAELTNLHIESTLFREADPWHRDQAEIIWNGSTRETHLLWIEDPSWSFVPARTASSTIAAWSVVGQYVRLGIEHILTGYDHIAFLIALIVTSRRIRSLLGVITAFTLAHSLSLACAATGLVQITPRIVEPLIALSIAYVGCRNLFERGERRVWLEAFGFGLVHGLGFAGSIAETLAEEKAKLSALFGFNLGVELGQLAIVIALVVALRLLPESHRERSNASRAERSSSSDALPGPRLAPIWIRVLASSTVALLGIYWFIARVSSA